MRTLGIGIPTYNRVESVLAAFVSVMNDRRVNEIAVVDDCSLGDTYARLTPLVSFYAKVRVRRNVGNLGSFLNKRRVVEVMRSSWIILLDSDNAIDHRYLDALYELPKWDVDTIYIPVWAEPSASLDYRAHADLTLTRENVAEHIMQPSIQMALNTGNFFLHGDTYLQVVGWEQQEMFASDGIVALYRWLASGRRVYFTPGLQYTHVVHDGHWMRTAAQSQRVHDEIVHNILAGVWDA